MRPNSIGLVVVLLIGLSAGREATAEPGSRWWPFGSHSADESPTSDPFEAAAADEAGPMEQPTHETETPHDEESDKRWMIDSRLGKVSWPRLHIPEAPKRERPQSRLWPRDDDSSLEADRNSWVQQDPTLTPASPWQAVTNGARRVGVTTRAAWHKTVDTLVPDGDSPSESSRVARRDQRPPWWKRMFTVEDRPPDGPQTVTEWMAQDRLDP